MTSLLQTGLAWLLQSTGLLLLGLAALRLARGRGPAAQTLIGHATLVGVALTLLLAGPLTGHVRPLWRVSLPADHPPAPNSGEAREAAKVALPVAVPPAPNPAPDVAAPAPTLDGTRPLPVVPDAPPVPVPVLTRLYATLAVLWGAGTLALLLWLGFCQWHLTRLGRAARALTSGPAADALTDLSPRPPRLLAHPAVRSPFLAGILRPAIFLPTDAETDFTPAALRAILAHELAHLARRDNAWTLVCRVLCAVLWPQPLLWLLCRRLEQIGEEACDLSVLAQNCPPRAYADCLLTLAKRWQPSRRERTLGAGITPFRSSIAKRITKILTAGKPLAPLTRRLRFGVAVCALLAICGSSALLNAGADSAGPDIVRAKNAAYIDVSHFIWAKRQGWAVRPIRIIDLDHPGLTRVASLPGEITERDKATVEQLSHRPGIRPKAPEGVPVSEKTRLESVLATKPHFFYAEYLLGIWYRQHGDAARASALLTQALRDAPVVLAGRYEYDDGTPLAGFHFQTTILCYSPTDLKAKNAAFPNTAIWLNYSDVVTDADGCYYLPVFRAIYSQKGVGWGTDEFNRLTAAHLKAHADLVTPGPSTSGETTSDAETRLSEGFVAGSRVAVMPQTEVRPRVTLSAPFNAADGSPKKPIQIHGSKLTISWRPYPKAVSYKVQVDEHHPYYDGHGRLSGDEWNEVQASSENPSRLGLPISQTSVSLDFAGSDPVFNRTYPYTFTVLALDRDGETISQSDQYDFQVRNALAPQPLTKAALAQALGPGFVVTSIQSQKDKVVVNAITPANYYDTPEKDNAIDDSGRSFGLGFGSWSTPHGLILGEANPAQSTQITYSRTAF